MRFSFSMSGEQFTAKLKLPLKLLLAAAITIGGFVAEAIRCESNIRELRTQLAHHHHETTGGAAISGDQ